MEWISERRPAEGERTMVISGCNRGIGRAIVEKFIGERYHVIACVREADDVFRGWLSELSQRENVGCAICQLDLSSEESISKAVKDIVSSKVNLDVLINNAGVVTKGLLQMTSIQSIKDTFQVNFFGHVQLTQGLIRMFIRQKGGVILNMCSVGGMDAYPAYVSYGCSKAAMIYFTKTMSQELAPYGVRVNGIAPSMTDTRMREQMGEEANEEILRRTAMKRVAEPSEVANLAYYLASSESSFITGQIVRIDGGM